MFILRRLRPLVALLVVLNLSACDDSSNDAPTSESDAVELDHQVTASNVDNTDLLNTVFTSGQRKGVYLLMGQSNMVGFGDLADLPEDFPVNGSHLFVVNEAGDLDVAEAPIQGARVGPGIAFADAIYSEYPYLDVGIVSCAASGTFIDQWYPDQAVDSLYGFCMQQIKVAMESAELLGVLWYQGESDTFTSELMESWSGKFKFIIDSLRSDLNMTNLPVSYAQIAEINHDAWDDTFVFWDEMKAEQELLSGELMNQNVTMIRTDDLTLNSDGLHLDTAAQLEVGRRFAAEMVYYLTSDFY
ncbi:MAG: hypothetical protein COB51_05630 [Moraxellaceae bacterium]|nr:MAG: hypothetical protein COB51_05630 [Moraxellaceae bacterium]